MNIFIMISLTFLWFYVVHMENPFKIVQKSINVEYRDGSVLDASAKVYKFNKTNAALNFTFKLKKELSLTDKFSIRGFLWINDEYRMGYFQMKQPLVRTMGMDTFDVQSLCLEYTRPALIWPLQTKITYRSLGWNPDTERFPTMLPGKWKIVITGSDVNDTKFLVSNWYIEIVYK